MNQQYCRLGLLIGALLAFGGTGAQAFVQTYDYFDTNWPGTESGGWPAVSNNVLNPVSGWRANQIRIVTAASDTAPYSAFMPTNAAPSGESWVLSPLLSNGVGLVTFAARNVSAGKTNTLNVEFSTDGSTWITNGVVTNTANTFFTRYTNTVNTFTNGYIRLRKSSEGTLMACYLDTLSITTPRPLVTVSNVTSIPAAPQNGDTVNIQAAVSTLGFYSSLSVVAWWWDAFGTSNSIVMATNSQGLYVTSSSIPARPAGATISYYVSTTYTTDEGSFTTNTPAAPTQYTVRERSGYTNVTVTGSIVTNLLLTAPYQWRSAIPAPALTNPAVQFLASSNGLTATWGDANPAVSNLPVYGQAEVGAAPIVMRGSVTTPLAFTFDEQMGAYNIQRCVYENFDAWTNRPFGAYTNNGWALVDGSITNGVSLAFRGASAILNGKPSASTNSYVLSPYLTNGIGQVSLWLRSYEVTGAPPAIISVQKAAAPTSSVWTEIATTNTTATNYIYLTVGQSDRDSHAIRVINNAAGANARVCLDEIIICEPGAGVVVTNLINTPTTPTILDQVNIAANINAVGGATNLQAQAWYRFGTSGVFDAIAMVNDSANHFVTATPIPHADVGVVQYYITCAFTGFLSEVSSPASFPPGGAGTPYSYAATVGASYTEYFDTNWPGTESTNSTGWPAVSNNVVNPVSGWTVNQIRLVSAAYDTFPFSANMPATASPTGESWAQSPFFSNTIGRVTFACRNVSVNKTNLLSVEYSTDAVTWVTNGVVTVTQTVFRVYTNIFSSASNGFIRIRKASDGTLQSCYLDTIAVSWLPARIAITNVFINPGYPAAADTVNVSCVITSLNSLFPTVNIDPTLYYRKSGTANYSSIKMTRTSGTTYTAVSSIPTFPRETTVEYYIRTDFKGYHFNDSENQSPTFYPAAGASGPTNYVVRQFASEYGQVAALVNGQQAPGRLLDNRLWQIVFNQTTSTNRLTIGFSGSGYSIGAGYTTNVAVWGNTNAAWQSALPLAETASTGQAPVSITGSFLGQYVARFNDRTYQYEIRQCVWQDFDAWASTAGKYILSANDAIPPVTLNFDSWPTNDTRVRRADFDGPLWQALTTYTNAGFGDDIGYAIYGSKIEVVGTGRVRTTNNAAPGVGFVIEASQAGTDVSVLRGVGAVSYNVLPTTTNPPASFSIYLFPTNRITDELSYKNSAYWVGPLKTESGLTNTALWTSNSITINTSQTYTVIFAHDSGDQSLYIDNLSVSEWYSETRTSNNWTASECWIERALRSGGGNDCRFDITRAEAGKEQYLQSPVMTKGVNRITFKYSAGNTTPVSFDVLVSYGDPNTWTNVITSVTNTFQASEVESVYKDFSYPLLSQSSNIYIRIRNTTPAPGILLLDDVELSSYALTGDWEANNMAVDSTPPGTRQFYQRAAYINSNRVADISTPTPFTNMFPYIRSPNLASGLGEISFWYRNWNITGTSVPPATLVIQKSAVSSTNDGDWYPVATITNIVNTNDYVYYRTTMLDPDRHFVRIYNQDTGTAARVCIDDILVAAPLAATVSMTNMVTIPAQPVYTDTVAVAVDLYNLFLGPSNIHMKAYYGTAANYAGLSSATLTYVGEMTCIASNTTVPGQWYRYQTTQQKIPATDSDTFVRYFVTAEYDGLRSTDLTPRTNQAFGVYPTWYEPMTAVYGTNMAYYVVYSCPTGSVWFNEINYMDNYGEYNKQFIELCGVAGVNIRNWMIDIADGGGNFVAEYVVTNNYVLNNETNNRGFWVLGKPTVTNIDMVLTNQYSGGDPGQSMPSYTGGRLSLRRPWGATEHRISYEVDGSSAGFPFIGYDSLDYTYGTLGLRGSGTNYGDFAWTEADGMSPGLQNAGQYLYGTATQQNTPPTILITSFWGSGTSVWIVCTRTNGWYPTPWVSTNLTASTWTNAPVLSSVLTATNATIQCTTNRVTPAFYRIMATNGP